MQNKAQKWVFAAIKYLRWLCPILMRGIDTDDGSEFINDQLLRYCQAQQITFTRSGPYRKNDTCYVEQKSDAVVRRTVGYARYESPEALEALNELYEVVRLLVNFFSPSAKLIQKTRVGSKVYKKYDTPQTPYQRVLNHPAIDSKIKEKLQEQFRTLDPVALKRRLDELTERLLILSGPQESEQRARAAKLSTYQEGATVLEAVLAEPHNGVPMASEAQGY